MLNTRAANIPTHPPVPSSPSTRPKYTLSHKLFHFLLLRPSPSPLHKSGVAYRIFPSPPAALAPAPRH